MTGAQSWCLALAGPGNVGKMIAWIGTAMFVALAIGSPSAASSMRAGVSLRSASRRPPER